MSPRVTMARYDTGHIFAEIGKTGRCVGNVTPRSSGFSWSSLNTPDTFVEASLREVERLMVTALRAEGFDVPEQSTP